MSKNIKFIDNVLVENSISKEVSDSANSILERNQEPKLKVTIDATNSGVLTNLRVYPAKFVSEGYKSFISKDKGGTAAFDKPVLTHHDLSSDPIGRVVGARYTPLKSGSDFENDFLNPDPMGGKGSGVVTIDAIITDKDAIKKVLDNRYLTVSVGHQSDYYLCSICGDSIMECTHIPGSRYDEEGDKTKKTDGRQCFVITGPLSYREVSFVNEPAQPNAKILTHSWTDSQKDSWTEISGLINSSKETVRTFTLFDEEGELSLLDGKLITPPKKTIITVSPVIADKLKQIMSKAPTADVTSDVRHSNGSERQTVEQNLIKAKNLDSKSKKETNMDANKELDDLKTEVKSLKDQLTAAQTKITDLTKEVEAKDGQIGKLNTDSVEFNKRIAKSLAVSLASLKIRLKKPGSEGIDSKEKLEAYVEKLATRSLDSLQDSIEDLLFEVETPKDEPKKEDMKKPADLAKQDKLTAPIEIKGKKPNSDSEGGKKKDERPSRALDVLGKSLGI